MRKIEIFMMVMFFGIIHSALAQDPSDDTFGKWQFRLRGIVVAPDESADIETIGGDASIATAVVPELDISYFFDENWSLELILATARHDVEAVGTTAGDLDLGRVWLLPPTLTGQYHFTGGNFVPYVGAGINLTFFYGVDEGPVADDVQYDTSLGFALQGGLDYMLNDKWFLNIDIKRLFLSTDVTVDATSALNATVDADVDINPWIIGFGVGLKL
ncbi:MAG: OmpW family outer membrane protein [Bacteroidota bacterium]